MSDALERRWRNSGLVVALLHAIAQVALCWQHKLTPDEANYVHAGTILRQTLRWDAFNTTLHGPLAFYPNQIAAVWHDPASLVAYAPFGRLGFVPYTLLAALGLWRIAARAFGARAAFGALVLWATCPLVLGHGSLMTADMALTCASLWTLERTYAWLQQPNLSRLLAAGALLGASLATKYLGLFLVPILALALGIWLLRGFAPELLFSRHSNRAASRVADAGLAVLLVAASATVALHTAYLWQPGGYSATATPPRSAAVQRVTEHGVGAAALALLPSPWVRGVDYQMTVSEGQPTFLGNRVAPGFWSYYLVAFGVKLPLLALLLIAIGALLPRRWPNNLGILTTLATAVPLVFLSGITTLQIGIRYALPIVPWLCLMGARAMDAAARRSPALVAALTLTLAFTAARDWPNFQPAFNTLAPRPYLWFMDSTLDWRVPSPHEPEVLRLQARHPEAQRITGAAGPRFGTLLVHGEQLARRDPLDPSRVHHWLRRFWPVDHDGAWFVFRIGAAAFAAAVDRATDRPRAHAEFAAAWMHAGDLTQADAQVQAAGEHAAALGRVLAALRAGDAAARATALAELGHHDLVIALGEAAPRLLRAQSHIQLGEPGAAAELLQPPLSELESYVLAVALESLGQAARALAVLEAVDPSPAAAALHAAGLARLRAALAAQRSAEVGR